jgi:hypothetical protein
MSERMISIPVRLLEELHDPSPCRYDHNGDCQEHACFGLDAEQVICIQKEIGIRLAEALDGVTDTERVENAKTKIAWWIENLKYNRDQATTNERKGRVNARIKDFLDCLDLLDGGEDNSINRSRGRDE